MVGGLLVSELMMTAVVLVCVVSVALTVSVSSAWVGVAASGGTGWRLTVSLVGTGLMWGVF